MRNFFRRPRWPQTYMGFPVGDGEETALPAKKKKRGIAMIIAIMVISIMMLFSADLILTSQVDLELAVKRRDNLKAEYMAKAAFNASLLLLSADFAFDLFQAQQSNSNQLSDGLGDFWTALNGIPIGGETLEMMSSFQESFDLNKTMDSGVLQQLELFDGSFVVNVEDETSKINLNYCHTGYCTETILMLQALFSCPAEKTFLETKRVNPQEMAYKIKDWIDSNSTAKPEESGLNDEDDPYGSRTPKMKAKNAPMDTLDELLLVDGWDQDLHAVFSPYITLWPLKPVGNQTAISRLNINTTSRALLGCLFPESRGECSEKSTLALKTRDNDKSSLGGAGKNVKDVLRETLCFTAEGKEGDANDRSNWFAQTSSVFKVRGEGMVGDQMKVLEVVVERVMPDPKKKQTRSYKILSWKLI